MRKTVRCVCSGLFLYVLCLNLLIYQLFCAIVKSINTYLRGDVIVSKADEILYEVRTGRACEDSDCRVSLEVYYGRTSNCAGLCQ